MATTTGRLMVVAVAGALCAGSGSAAAAPGLPRLGVMADVGVPDGGTASLVVRPLSRLRLNVGVAHNAISPGVRAGLTLVPLSTWFTPTLSVSCGRFYHRDANPLVRAALGDPTFSSPALEQVGYDYADADVGLELGQRRFTFYLQAGVTRVTGQIHGLDAMATGTGDTSVTFTRSPDVALTTVSARLGFVIYIL